MRRAITVRESRYRNCKLYFITKSSIERHGSLQKKVTADLEVWLRADGTNWGCARTQFHAFSATAVRSIILLLQNELFYKKLVRKRPQMNLDVVDDELTTRKGKRVHGKEN